MRLFPREIEADLLFRGIDIHDWHQGRMSSRRLLVLIEAISADADSMLSRERRDGDWSLKEYLEAAQVNEIRLLRADQAAIHAGHEMKINFIQSPSQSAEEEVLADRVRDLRSHVLKAMNTTE